MRVHTIETGRLARGRLTFANHPGEAGIALTPSDAPDVVQTLNKSIHAERCSVESSDRGPGAKDHYLLHAAIVPAPPGGNAATYRWAPEGPGGAPAP
jgi:hypothetical protein